MVVQGRQQLKITHTKGKKRQVGVYFEDTCCTQTCPTLDSSKETSQG
jgi:hypothetical protein